MTACCRVGVCAGVPVQFDALPPIVIYEGRFPPVNDITIKSLLSLLLLQPVTGVAKGPQEIESPIDAYPSTSQHLVLISISQAHFQKQFSYPHTIPTSSP